MFHPADRILRQFGMRQDIPVVPLSLSYSTSNAISKINRTIGDWNNHFENYYVRELTPSIQNQDEYMGDYSYTEWWGSPRMINRSYQFTEYRFKFIFVDDQSLRAFADGMD